MAIPKVSAIVSAYYAEKYLDARIRNLVIQQPRPEVVAVCQRGSKEEYILNSMRENVDVYVVTDDIPTVYAAWNMGIKQASGDYITNANCDDRLYPSALAALSSVLYKNKDIAVAYADVDIVEQIGGSPVGRYTWKEGGLAELMEGCFLGPMPLWRKSLHEKYGMFDAEMHSAGDYEFWLRLAAGGEKFFHIKQPFGAYLKRKDSVEHREELRSVWEAARAKSRYGGNWL